MSANAKKVKNNGMKNESVRKKFSEQITGRKKEVLAKFKRRRDRGIPLKGPYFPKQADRMVKRAIRGMIPYKQPKGREALSRVICHKGVPPELKDKKFCIVSKIFFGALPSCV